MIAITRKTTKHYSIMNLALWKQSIRESWLLLVGCIAGVYSFAWLRVWLTSLLPMSRFETILKQVPESILEFLPVDLDQIITMPGRIALTYDDPTPIMLMVFWAVSRGSNVVSGPLGLGTLEMLLAQPISRLQILTINAVITTLGVALIALGVWAGTWTGIATTHALVDPPPKSITIPLTTIKIPLFDEDAEPIRRPMSEMVDAKVFVPATINFFALGFLLAGLSTFISSWDRYRWRTIGIVATIYVVQVIIKLIGMADEDWHWLLGFTFFTAYEPQHFVSIAMHLPEESWSWLISDGWGIRATGSDNSPDLGPLTYYAILLGLGLAGYISAAVVFCRRDLPAPL